MTNSYVLVNPYVKGDFKNEIKADNSKVAAQIFYKNLSEHFNNAVPKFYFTIQKGGSGKGKYYHFETKEKRSNDEVKFVIKPYNIKDQNMDQFKTRLETFKNKINQEGGKKHKKHSKKHDSDSSNSESDSSSEEYYKQVNTYTPSVSQPIYYWWYDPYVYKLDSLFIATFYAYVTPTIELSLVSIP